MKTRILTLVLLFVLAVPPHVISQEPEKKAESHFQSTITLTSKGISTIPSFTLGKPALMFDLSMGKGKLSFDPLFRFALEGKPWTFVFWFRYNNLIDKEKFNLTIGGHPALAFKSTSIVQNGISKESIIARRYLASELAPNWLVSKNVSLGIYHLFTHSLEKDVVRNTNFLALKSNFSNLKVSEQLFLKFLPQIYFLKADNTHGYYLNATLTLAKKGFPLSLSSQVNKAIKSNVAGSPDHVWNLNLVYNFSKKYSEL